MFVCKPVCCEVNDDTNTFAGCPHRSSSDHYRRYSIWISCDYYTNSWYLVYHLKPATFGDTCGQPNCGLPVV